MEQTTKYRWPIIISSIILLIIVGLVVWRLFLPKKSPVELTNNNENINSQPLNKQPDFKTADDLDGDGLSNAAEQEFGSNPEKADSDGDGIDDYQQIFGRPRPQVN